ncbi:MAG: 50S ribosomal protein L24 [Anaerolineaceae bacterium]|nr:50S ribosomal protein L24 [Anaerolineaceae bacterium]
MQRIKKGDTVELIAGKDAAEARRNGRTVRGTVNRVVPGYKIDRMRRKVGRDPEKDRVVVQGVNIIIKHQRRTGDVRTQFGRIELEAPIHISNVMLVCPSCKKATRVGFRTLEDGTKSRYCKSCDELID